jgi:TonB family protein
MMAKVQKDPLHISGAYSLIGVAELPVSGEHHPLRREAPKWVSWGSMIALVVGLSLFLTWQWWTKREESGAGAHDIQVVRYSELGVPPSIARSNSPALNVSQAVAVAPPSIAVPEPVPDELASRQTIATQSEIAQALAPITQQDMGAGGGGIVVEGGLQKPDMGGGSGNEPVIELPVRLSCQPPVYPAMARQAGVEGTVMLHVLVGKDGHVKRVTFVDGPNMLKDAAIAAAQTAVFKPASSNGKPVEVWVAFPLAFKLRAGMR